MRLPEFQRALVEQIRQACSPGARMELKMLPEHDEHALWLSTISTTTGFKVTCDIQRWWRMVRIKTTAVFTCRMLETLGQASRVDAYLERFSCETLFILPEALAFLRYVIDEPDTPVEARLVAEFEYALLKARLTSSGPNKDVAGSDLKPDAARLRLNPAVTLACIPAAMVGARQSEDTARSTIRFVPVMVSACIERYWRILDEEEYVVLTEILEGGELNSLQQRPDSTVDVIRRLAREGVLVGNGPGDDAACKGMVT